MLITITSVVSAQQRIFVDVNANGLSTGQNWANAYTDLHTAIRNAESGATIWIARGVYKTSINGNRFSSFHINKSLSIFGGFAGVEQALEDRRPNNITVLSGEIGLPDVVMDNSYQVLRIDEPNAKVIVEGVVIEGAYGDFIGENDFFLDEVGAVLIDNVGGSNMSISFEQVIFRNNYAVENGGAIYIQDKSTSTTFLKVEGCTFTHDIATADGSAIYGSFNSDGVSVIIQSSFVDDISDNHPSFTAIQLLFNGVDNQLLIDDCIFSNNVTKNPDPILAFGLFGYSDFTLSNSRFLNNEYGQIMFVSASSADEPSNIVIENVDIIDNVTFSSPLQVLNTAFGEARSNVSIDQVNITKNVNGDTWILIDLHEVNLLSFDNNTFIDNKGGPLFLNPIYDDLTINNLLVANNSFLDVDFTNQFVFKNFENYDITFNNSTFAYNEGIKGTIIRTFFNKDNGIIGNINFNNCILFGNQDLGAGQPIEQMVYAKNMSVNYDHCLMDATSCDQTVFIEGLGRVTCSDSNLLGSDPVFISTNNFNLSYCSPAIDVGDNEVAEHLVTDVVGDDRIINKKVDLGALESTPVTESFGFNCSQGFVYSDWLPGLDDNLEVKYIENNLSTALEGEAAFEVKGQGGCIDTFLVDVFELNSIVVADVEDPIRVSLGDSIYLSYINFSAEELEWAVFLDGQHLNIRVLKDLLVIQTLGSGTYDIIAVNQFGCFFKESIEVEINDITSILYVPNIVSPNSDGVNDDLMIAPLNNKSLVIEDFVLVNRWGNVLFSERDIRIDRAVTLIEGHRFTAAGLRPDVYVYHVTLTEDDVQYILQGNITIVN